MKILTQRGDTIVEVVIALAILASILVSTFSLIVRAYALGRAANERTQIVNLVQQQSERLRNMRDQLAAGAYPGVSWNGYNGAFKNQLRNITSTFDPNHKFHVDVSGGSMVLVDGPDTPSGVAAGTAQVYVRVLDPSVNSKEEIMYTVEATWKDSYDPNPKASLVSFLVDIDGLQPQNCSAIKPQTGNCQ